MLYTARQGAREADALFQRAEAEKHMGEMGEMGEILKTDLTELEGNPTPRAAPQLQQERCQLELWTRPGGPAVKLDTQTFAASPLATAVTTVLLIAVGCVVMGVAAMIGAPLWAAIGGLLVPAAVYAAIRAIHRNGDP